MSQVRRRHFPIAAAGLAALSLPALAQREKRVRRIGFLSGGSLRSNAAWLAASLAFVMLFSPQLAKAQFPSKPVRLVVTVSLGGAPDILARVVAERLSPLLGQPLVVENRAGANGNIAMDLVARSVPDGHTLALCADSMITINPHLYAKMPLDTLKDLLPVAPLAQQNGFLLAVHPSVPARNFREFIEYARKATPPLAYGSAGPGSQHQMTMEMLKLRAGIDLVHVPYKGGAMANAGAIAGEVSAMFAGPASIEPHIRAGRMRGLAMSGPSRSSVFPEMPTIAEFYPGYQVSTWLGVFAPAGVPDANLSRLRAGIAKVMTIPEVKERLRAGGLEPYAATPEEFAGRIRSDHEKYGKLVKEIGLKIE